MQLVLYHIVVCHLIVVDHLQTWTLLKTAIIHNLIRIGILIDSVWLGMCCLRVATLTLLVEPQGLVDYALVLDVRVIVNIVSLHAELIWLTASFGLYFLAMRFEDDWVTSALRDLLTLIDLLPESVLIPALQQLLGVLLKLYLLLKLNLKLLLLQLLLLTYLLLYLLYR